MPLSDYKVIDVDPDISEDRFFRILLDAGSPAAAAATAVYRYCTRRRVSPAFMLAMFRHESRFGLVGTATQTRSWGNTRRPSFGGVPEMGTVPGRSGVFPVFANWVDGGISTAARFLDHAPYAGKTTVATIIPVWAPPTDLNDTPAYIRNVLASINGYARGIVEIGNTLLGAAHAGTGGSTVAVSKPPMQINPSPNRGGYAHPHEPKALCWHITAGTSSLGWLTNPASGASSNYLIDRDGTTHELVPPTVSAWANGKSCKPDMGNPIVKACIDGGRNLNTATISIEHEGKSSLGKGGSLTQAQIAATVKLSAWLCATFGIAPDRGHILGHFQVDACDRPNCPGFSAAEWQSWVGKVAALVGGTTPPAPPSGDPGFPAALNPDGSAVLNGVQFGGTLVRVEWVELGGVNAAGERFKRKWSSHQLEEWVEVR